VDHAVKGMLPKNKLGADLFRNLRVYAEDTHQQDAQNPKSININEYL
jgi:large subunit ribosomal protein L13